MPGSTTANYQQDKGDGLYRRSMYTLWKRTAPPASMHAAAEPELAYATPVSHAGPLDTTWTPSYAPVASASAPLPPAAWS